MSETLRLVASTAKLRIGVAITLCAVAGILSMPSATAPDPRVLAVLALAVLVASGAAGAFNQLVERDLDARMRRTSRRPFVTGRFRAGLRWHGGLAGTLLLAVAAAVAAAGWLSALYVFLGAVTYGVVYTVWLKRRTPLNIVVGGLAGTFAVLAGAAAVSPVPGITAVVLAVVLFLWTPPHFWSLAFVHRDEYRSAGVPMLPAVLSPRATARVIHAHTLALGALSLLPVALGAGLLYAVPAAAGALLFAASTARLSRRLDRRSAWLAFVASLAQLVLLLGGVIAAGLAGSPLP